MISTFNNSARMVLLGVLLLASHSAMAIGLGNAVVESYLGQPLVARIDLITGPTDDLSNVTAGLASADDFALIGASRAAISVPLRFEVQTSEEGTRILVTSDLAVRDPVIRLIVEVNWSSGRLLREYTLFLDPPTVASPAPAPTPSRSDDRRPTRSEPSATAPAAAETPSAAPLPEPGAGEFIEPGDDEYGPVRSGDTLWRIASNWSQGSGMNINQVMVAIQRSNPQAFINNNINLLKKGAILRMPRREVITGISPAVARAEVTEQAEAFETTTVSAPAVETPLVDEGAAASTFDSDSSSDYSEGQLEIVPPSEDVDADSAYGFEESGDESDADVGVQALREELARTEEDLISEQQENEYLRQRIEELEGSLAETDSGATVADQDLAQLENRLREDRLAEADTPEPASPVQQSAPPKVTTASSEDSPWYDNALVWIIALLLAIAIVIGWIISRRSSADDFPAQDEGTVRNIKDEAEEILKVLSPKEQAVQDKAAEKAKAPGEGKQPAADADGAGQAEAGADGTKPAEGEQLVKKSSGKPRHQEEAEILDEDSADPEVRLDLARAYISMGDKEAARVILDEVIEHGSDEQKAEAESMLKDL